MSSQGHRRIHIHPYIDISRVVAKKKDTSIRKYMPGYWIRRQHFCSKSLCCSLLFMSNYHSPSPSMSLSLPHPALRRHGLGLVLLLPATGLVLAVNPGGRHDMRRLSIVGIVYSFNSVGAIKSHFRITQSPHHCTHRSCASIRVKGFWIS